MSGVRTYVNSFTDRQCRGRADTPRRATRNLLFFRISYGNLALGVDPAHHWCRSPLGRHHVGNGMGSLTYHILSIVGFSGCVYCDCPEMLHVLTSHLSLRYRGNPIGPGLVKSLLHVWSYVKRSFFRDSNFSAGYTGWQNPLVHDFINTVTEKRDTDGRRRPTRRWNRRRRNRRR